VAVIVTEYVDVARAFFEEDEPKIVNAVLDRLARKYRAEQKPETGLTSHGVSRSGGPRRDNRG
jgi:N utilization substance protein B